MSVTKEQWHLDKRVPISLILALAMHLGGSIWFASGLVKDQDAVDRRVQALEQARSSERIGERIAVLESQVADTKASTLRTEANVQKLLERRSAP